MIGGLGFAKGAEMSSGQGVQGVQLTRNAYGAEVSSG